MNNWIQNLEKISLNAGHIKESEILFNLPSSLYNDWDNFMRGKTCPVLENGEHGVYSWDLNQFLNRF
jgi:hypothetical protein